MISICVPIYNTIDYLGRCVDSLCNQTYKDLEIILVDDGSTDGSGELCDKLKAQDTRIRVIHQINKGEAAARNAGVHAAKGEYIAFCDSDDEYFPSAFGKMIELVEECDADLVVSGYIEDGKEEKFEIPRFRFYSKEKLNDLLLESECAEGENYIFSTVNAKIFRTSIIRQYNISFDERFKIGNDTLFMCDFLQRANIIANTFLPAYRYYKFDISERVQGMSWEYPDELVYRMLVRYRRLMMADAVVSKEKLVPVYMRTIEGLINITRYEELLDVDMGKYVVFCRENIPPFEDVAKWESDGGIIRDKYKNGIPYDIVAHLICQKKDKELVDFLCLIGCINRKNGEDIYNHVRLQINL